MKFFRSLSTQRLLLLLAAVVALAAGGAAVAVSASGSPGETPPPAALDAALHSALSAGAPAGITADITFTNGLLPSGSLLGSAGSALMSGATGRLWASNDGRGRLELQSDASGDVQIVWNATEVTAYDASSNTVYSFKLPAQPASSGADTTDTGVPPSVSEIATFLSQIAPHASVSDAQPDNVAGQPAYTVSVSPKHDGGLLGSVQLAWDAAHGVPLRLAVYAQGSTSPVLALEATHISYGAISEKDIAVTPPAGAKVVDLSSLATNHTGAADSSQTPVTGLDAVQAAADFPVAAPTTLVGLPRQDVQLVGGKNALAVYGQGLGAVVLLERKADAGGANGMLSNVPTVSLDGVTAHELATQLGTILEWKQAGVDYVLAGSMPPAAAEAAARALR